MDRTFKVKISGTNKNIFFSGEITKSELLFFSERFRDFDIYINNRKVEMEKVFPPRDPMSRLALKRFEEKK